MSAITTQSWGPAPNPWCFSPKAAALTRKTFPPYSTSLLAHYGVITP